MVVRSTANETGSGGEEGKRGREVETAPPEATKANSHPDGRHDLEMGTIGGSFGLTYPRTPPRTLSSSNDKANYSPVHSTQYLITSPQLRPSNPNPSLNLNLNPVPSKSKIEIQPPNPPRPSLWHQCPNQRHGSGPRCSLVRLDVHHPALRYGNGSKPTDPAVRTVPA